MEQRRRSGSPGAVSGLQREQRVDVVGGVDAQRLDAAQVADVAADFVLGPGVTADEFEGGIGGDGRYGAFSDVARRPLDDAIGSGVWHSLSIG
jgi:hypothetical protein